VQAFAKIARAQALFASRGDDSGTHKKELELWKAADVDAEEASGIWYRELGQGMGPTLNTAAGMNAYTLTDRGTWLSFVTGAISSYWLTVIRRCSISTP
jgi:tungstate transport system substrate-binding protein